MIENWTDLSENLSQNHVHSSAPTRLSCGGSTDHRLAGLVCKPWQPATANIAIDLRARVSLRPYVPGRVFVDLQDVGERELAVPDVPLSGPFSLVSALVCYFGVHGFHIEIRTDFPFQSGLGGSGAVAVAVIGAFHAALDRRPPGEREYPGIVRLAHNLEDSLFGNTGLQDQAAAVYGGVNLWEWRYSERLEFERTPVDCDSPSLGDHILLAYSGRPHPQSRDGSRILDRFKEEGAVSLFASISETARMFAESLERRDYRAAGERLSEEFRLRSRLIQVALPEDRPLFEMAASANCGVGVTGHGGGGCLWAIGEAADIAGLRDAWQSVLTERAAGAILHPAVSGTGLEVGMRSADEPLAMAEGVDYE